MIAPHIVKPLPKVVHGQVGEITTLEAKAYGKPTPVTKWLKDGQEIHESEHFLIDNYADGTSILTISNAEPETIDRITFEAASPLGVAKTVAELHVEGIWIQSQQWIPIALELIMHFFSLEAFLFAFF